MGVMGEDIKPPDSVYADPWVRISIINDDDHYALYIIDLQYAIIFCGFITTSNIGGAMERK